MESTVLYALASFELVCTSNQTQNLISHCFHRIEPDAASTGLFSKWGVSLVTLEK
jgi:hypothetical protein